MDRIVKKRVRTFFSMQKDVEYLYITRPNEDASFSYFSGMKPKNLFYSSLLISKDDFRILVPEIERNAFQDVDCEFFRTSDEKKQLMKKLIVKKSRIGINAKRFTYDSGKQLEKLFGTKNVVDVSEAIYTVRASKDDSEIENIRKACNIVSKVARRLPELIKPKMSEIQLSRDIDAMMYEYGSIKPAFETLVGFGKNAALAHPPVGKAKLANGNLILVDFGATHNSGYKSDISRTFVFGEPSFIKKKMYSGVSHAKSYTENALGCGISMKQVQENAAELLKRFPGELTHSIGHSLGLDVHDGFAFGQDFIIPDNYITTIEPGLYNPAVGGVRIEDDYVVTKKGVRCLTKKAGEKLIEL